MAVGSSGGSPNSRLRWPCGGCCRLVTQDTFRGMPRAEPPIVRDDDGQPHRQRARGRRAGGRHRGVHTRGALGPASPRAGPGGALPQPPLGDRGRDLRRGAALLPAVPRPGDRQALHGLRERGGHHRLGEGLRPLRRDHDPAVGAQPHPADRGAELLLPLRRTGRSRRSSSSGSTSAVAASTRTCATRSWWPTAIALAVFMVYPVAPPRLAATGDGFVDTLHQISDVDLHGGMLSGWFNPHAAVPSMHFGYAVMIGMVGTGAPALLAAAAARPRLPGARLPHDHGHREPLRPRFGRRRPGRRARLRRGVGVDVGTAGAAPGPGADPPNPAETPAGGLTLARVSSAPSGYAWLTMRAIGSITPVTWTREPTRLRA